jgi:hypothetical protein
MEEIKKLVERWRDKPLSLSHDELVLLQTHALMYALSELEHICRALNGEAVEG